MIKPIDLKKFTKNLVPVETPEIFSSGGSALHPKGIASELIFGPQDSGKQKTTFSYIELNTEVIHPALYEIVKRLDRRIEKIISTELFFMVNESGEIIEVSEDMGETGLSNFIKAFSKIKMRGGTGARDTYVKLIEKCYNNGSLFIDRIIVIPPYFRPIYQTEDGQWVIDAINEIYISILRKTISIKSQQQHGILGDLFRFGIQRVVNQHHEFIKKKIAKKDGLIRNKLMGKRVDYSARSVISTNPQIKSGQIGIPFRMLTKLFEPFLVFYMLRSGRVSKEQFEPLIKEFDNSLEYGPDAVIKIIRAIQTDERLSPDLKKLFWVATEAIAEKRMVLAKRDPVLIPESYQAFRPILIDGHTIQLCPIHVGSFNADFDGDQMAIVHPLSNESQKELHEKASRIYSSGSTSGTTIEPSKDILLGLYILTKPSKDKNSPINLTDEDIPNINDPYQRVVFRNQNTTAGQAIYNWCFPKDFPFYTGIVTKKVVKSHLDKCQQKYNQDEFKIINNRIMEQGFKWATIGGSSFTLDSIELPKYIMDLKKDLEGADPETATKILNQSQKEITKYLEDTGLGDILESGCAKGYGQTMQVIFAKGLLSDINGEIQPAISKSMAEGLDSKTFFAAGSGARAGIVGRVISTADTGYLARRLVYFLNTVELHSNLKDCNTEKTMSVKITDSDMLKRLRFRYVVQKDQLVKIEEAGIKIGDTIELRSPIYCKSKKLCHACYGRSYERIATPFVGVSAGLNIGEAATQSSMEKFHTGGAVKVVKKKIIDDLQSNNPIMSNELVKEGLRQINNELIAKRPISIFIDMTEYEQDKSYWVYRDINEIRFSNLISKIKLSDGNTYDFILDYNTIFDIRKIAGQNHNIIRFDIDKDEVILKTPTDDFGAVTMVRYMDRLIGGREMLKNEVHLLQKIYSQYKQISEIALIHLEILCSQILRDKTNPSIPARLANTWDPILINLKKTIYNEGFLQGLAFENMNEAIRSGLISNQKEPQSILEKVLIGADA